jgi:hypothetical protein
VKVSIKKPPQTSMGLQKNVFVMVGMMRSGSNLLERQLGGLADVRCHGELFNPAFVGLDVMQGKEQQGYTRESVDQRNEDELGFVKKLDAACDRPIMGLRLFLDHSPQMTARLLYDPAVKKIVLSRHLLESYVSLLLARETDVWMTTKEPVKRADPVKVEINKLINYALRQSLYYNDILSVLQQTGQSYRMIDYSEMNELEMLNDLAAFIGSKHRLAKVEQPLKKQNPGKLEDKVVEFAKLKEDLKKRQMLRWFGG